MPITLDASTADSLKNLGIGFVALLLLAYAIVRFLAQQSKYMDFQGTLINQLAQASKNTIETQVRLTTVIANMEANNQANSIKRDKQIDLFAESASTSLDVNRRLVASNDLIATQTTITANRVQTLNDLLVSVTNDNGDATATQTKIIQSMIELVPGKTSTIIEKIINEAHALTLASIEKSDGEIKGAIMNKEQVLSNEIIRLNSLIAEKDLLIVTLQETIKELIDKTLVFIDRPIPSDIPSPAEPPVSS